MRIVESFVIQLLKILKSKIDIFHQSVTESECYTALPKSLTLFGNFGPNTSQIFGLNEFKTVGELITKTLKGLSENPNDNSKVENEVKNEVISLTSSFPIYKNL